jgi:DNA-binding NarL/FixJ family response regulator
MKLKSQSFDLIISDVDLKKCDGTEFDYNEKGIISLKIEGGKSKLITIIRSKDNYRIYKILRTVRPDGFILQTELSISILVDLVKAVLNESVYYSQSIFNILNSNQTTSLILDDIDREILYLISKGVKTKNLPKYIPRSLSAFEKRKQRLKDLLVMDNCSDRELIEKAAIQKLI